MTKCLYQLNKAQRGAKKFLNYITYRLFPINILADLIWWILVRARLFLEGPSTATQVNTESSFCCLVVSFSHLYNSEMMELLKNLCMKGTDNFCQVF